ncbi:GlcG/HbpS family heme-binding protein [Novosphingobium percolationis]|uniref:GlcG/HbpS family heme-binding protein n=1 Tax=Novosphingobium percolationis TaxID=2871811 RepID=UPI001CD3EAB6|nr:heme-binding protein [Novosphingobium percolationis]
MRGHWMMLMAGVVLAGTAVAQPARKPFHETPAGPRALPGDRLPPFAMIDDKGDLPLVPPPLPPGVHLPQPGDGPESTAPGPNLIEATRMAQAALAACSHDGFRVGVAVVDSVGEARALLTADGADGSHVFVAMRKTEVVRAFGMASGAANAALQKDAGLRAKVTLAMFVEGGALPILRDGKLIGAIGVSGAAGMPVGHQDEVCAAAGLAAL